MRSLYDELFGFRREFDEMFNRILAGRPFVQWPELPAFKKELNFTPAVEAYVDKEAHKYVCRVTLPGVEPGVHGAGGYLRCVRESGAIADKLTAEYVNGVLEITAPIAAAALSRKIEVKTTAPVVKQVAA